MTIIEMKTEELIPYINNPRNNDGAVDYVAASIKELITRLLEATR